MNPEKALQLYDQIEKDLYANNLFARANARYILFGVNESRKNFPATLESNLNIGSDTLSFTYLSIACTLAEAGIFSERTKIALEKGAEIIEYNHLYSINRNDSSKYYLLIAALAYYASFQYSKAFILMNEDIFYETDLSQLVSAFLKKDFKNVNTLLNKILLNQDEYLNITEDNFLEKVNHPHIVIFAKAISHLMNYLYTGQVESLHNSTEILNDLEELLTIDTEPSLWWVARIFRIITNGFESTSLWANVIPLLPDSDKVIVRKYINNLIFGQRKVVELFTAQRATLPLIASDKGGVVSLPTSSGKTQIAILAILKTLTENEGCKVLYIAPYRSLAFEVEMALKESLDVLNFEVSQLYGSGQFGKLDKVLIEEANILIATPEKAKVILRANNEIANLLKLVIIDEGHLIDATQRNVKNELFIEELKVHIKNNEGKILLLSAVLPNTDDIAYWISDDPNLSVSESERLARQRLGMLRFSKNSVSLEWIGDERSFNRNFIRPIVSTRKKGKTQPENKAVATAMTALRLSEQKKSVLLFTSRARSVVTYAKAVIQSLKLLYGKEIEQHYWKDEDAWEELQLLCSEYDCPENRNLIEFAKFGVLCHYGGLNKDVRNTLERLMKSGNPRIIVATTTLGQGVNLGVSTVILADIDFYDAEKKKWTPITHNEIWNIIGRAGRAFQDVEGKILFVIENKEQENIALDYISKPIENITSGLLSQIKRIKRFASKCGVDFSLLLEMIAENDFKHFSTYTIKGRNIKLSDEFHEVFDWIDDTILAMDTLSEASDKSLDDLFRESLAYIQAGNIAGITQEEVIQFITARNDAIRKIIPANSSKRDLSTSSLPLASAVALDEIFLGILNIGEHYLESDQSVSQKIDLLKIIENTTSNFPSLIFKPKLKDDGKLVYPEELLNEARELWISGDSLSKASNVTKVIKLTNSYFTYTISWVLGAIANKCRLAETEELAIAFEELALFAELGLPDIISSKIYLSGIRSRTAAMEISQSNIFFVFASEDMSLTEIRQLILENIDELIDKSQNKITERWLQFIHKNHKRKKTQIDRTFDRFILPDHPNLKSTRLYVKTVDDATYYLANAEYTESFKIEVSDRWPFNRYANRMDFYFEYKRKRWELCSAV